MRITTTKNSKGVIQPVYPAPWTNGDASTNAIWDILEYTWNNASGVTCPKTAMGLDVSAVDDIGIPMALSVSGPGFQTLGPVGLAPNAGSNTALGLSLLGAPWSTLVQAYQYPVGTPRVRVLNPSHAVASAQTNPTATVNAGLNFPQNYLAGYMLSMCQTYSGTTFMPVGGAVPQTVGSPVPYVPNLPPNVVNYTVYGLYTGTCGTPSQTLSFYATTTGGSTPAPVGTPIATFNGVPQTIDALGNSGYFVQPADPGNTIGRILAVGINRSTYTAQAGQTMQSFPAAAAVTQPACSQGSSIFYGGTATNGGAISNLNASVITNWYSALAHDYAYNNSVYAFADDDECGAYAPYINIGTYTPPAGTKFVVTIEPF